jgi:acetyltransferase-like isoleucine patch superfamily enzyme
MMGQLSKRSALKRILIVPLVLYRKTAASVNWVYNRFTFGYKKVDYASFPIIKGRIRLYGEGDFVMGQGVRFNCSLDSNFVGLYKTCTIAVLGQARLEIGDHSGFSGVSIYCSEHIKIGKYVNCGGNVCIWDTDFHPLNYAERRVHTVGKIAAAPIIIGDDAFIGANSIVLKGVHIGDRSIIGAGSVVSKNIPPDEIWAGNPVKFIRKISEDA